MGIRMVEGERVVIVREWWLIVYSGAAGWREMVALDASQLLSVAHFDSCTDDVVSDPLLLVDIRQY